MSNPEAGKSKKESSFSSYLKYALIAVLGIATFVIVQRCSSDNNTPSPDLDDPNRAILPNANENVPSENEIDPEMESDPYPTLSPSSSVPEMVFTSGPDENGVTSGTYQGKQLSCATINRPDRWYDPSLPEKDYDYRLPPIYSGIQALSVIGVGIDGVDPGPYYIVRGDKNVEILHDLNDPSWEGQNSSTDICVEIVNK